MTSFITDDKEIHRKSLVNGKYKFITLLGLCAILYLIFPCITMGQTTNNPNDDSTSLSFSIDKTPLHVDDTFTLTLNVANITDLAGWECAFDFDPNIIEAVEVAEGDLLKSGGNTIFGGGTINNTTGQISDLFGVRQAKGGVSGTGTLFSVKFAAKVMGTTNITLREIELLDPKNKIIEFTPPTVEIHIMEQYEPNPVENLPILSWVLDTEKVAVGNTFTLHIDVENVTNLARWECSIIFDTDLLEAVEILQGDFLKTGNTQTYFDNGTIDQATGSIQGIEVIRFSGEGVNGTGRLLSITFSAKAIGEAFVTVNDLSVQSPNSDPIDLNQPIIPITITDAESAEVSFSIVETAVRVGSQFTLNLNISNATDIAAWLSDVMYDPAVLEAVEVSEGDFLKGGPGSTFFLSGIIDNTTGKITRVGVVYLNNTGVDGTGILMSVTFAAKKSGNTHVTLSNPRAGSSALKITSLDTIQFAITVEPGIFSSQDVNQDGEVNLLDLMQVAQNLGGNLSTNPRSDVNSDGKIDILDLIIVAGHISNSPTSAPSFLGIHNKTTLSDNRELIAESIQTWIKQAQIKNDGSTLFQDGIVNLQKLLDTLIPVKTKLLNNYPNPFNPETWIPYQLSEPGEVSLRIYSADGKIVRNFMMGYQNIGIYKNRSRAIYWNGKNNFGEPVASGLYFYTLTAGDFTATKKMLITK